MKRGGQVTIFVIIAVVIVVLVGLFFVFKKPLGNGNNSDISGGKLTLDGCFDKAVRDNLVKIGLQGGYITPKNGSVSFFGVQVPYYFYERENRFITIDEFKKNLASGIEEQFSTDCVRGFEDEEIQVIGEGKKETRINIFEDTVEVQMKAPVTITKAEGVTEIRDFKTTVYVRLQHLYDLAFKMVKIQEQDPYHICISCIDALRDHNVSIDGYTWQDNSMVYVLTDLNHTINDQNYRYLFAAKYIEYDCDNLPSDIDENIKEECELRNQG